MKYLNKKTLFTVSIAISLGALIVPLIILSAIGMTKYGKDTAKNLGYIAMVGQCNDIIPSYSNEEKNELLAIIKTEEGGENGAKSFVAIRNATKPVSIVYTFMLNPIDTLACVNKESEKLRKKFEAHNNTIQKMEKEDDQKEALKKWFAEWLKDDADKIKTAIADRG